MVVDGGWVGLAEGHPNGAHRCHGVRVGRGRGDRWCGERAEPPVVGGWVEARMRMAEAHYDRG